MRTVLTLFAAAALVLSCAPKVQEPALKDVLDGKFLIGAAVNEAQIRELDTRGDSVLFRHFNAVEPENCLKSGELMEAYGRYDWSLADAYVDFAEKHGLACFGHTLIWHSQLTPDFCYDGEGNLLSPEALKARMKEHITTVMTRYKGRIRGWDVVNEAFLDDGTYRPSPFWQILGEEFIPWAFQCAAEADPSCELYYNDYSMHNPEKLEAVLRMVKGLQERGVRIDAVGFQGHIGMDYPDLDLYERHIRRVKEETGLDVCITELDMSILPTLTRSADLAEMRFAEARRNPYPDGVPEEVQAAWNARMGEVMAMLLRCSGVVRRVNVWGVCDSDSWKNGWPVPERQDSPLFVDRNYELKPFVKDLIYGR